MKRASLKKETMMNATKTKKTFPTSIDLAPEARGAMIALLNQQLAGTFDL
jgi:hypothetical protein